MASPILPGTGLGSGLNVSSIVKALVGADTEAKQNQVTAQTKANNLKISGTGTLKSALAAYQAAMDKLNVKNSPSFSGFAATSSDTKVLTTTSDNTAVSGSYAIAVTSLATSSKVASAAFAGGATSAIPTGTLKISQNGTDYNVDVPAGSTLQSVRDAINTKLQSSGISANIVTDANGSRLVLGSTTTGAGSDISASGIAGLEIDGTTALVGSGAGAISAPAADAVFTVDGLSMTSKTNTVTGAVSGLSFTLLAGASGGVPAQSTITVATNTDGLKTSIQSFVDAYNTLVKTVNSLTQATADSDGKLTVAAAFTGDAMPRQMLAVMRNELVAPGAGSKLTVLSQLGVQTAKDGTLSFDSTKFNSAMTDKKLGGEVQTFFTGTTANAGADGLFARMQAALKPYTVSGTGILDTRTNSLNLQAKSLASQQDDVTRRVATLTDVLTKKYNAMDVLVGQLKATASNITSMFDAINAQNKS
jgi:flagellar hook-associated protein 2